jgi:LTXXQ motif family protein
MRWWTIPILGVVTVSMAMPAPAEARPRFGPGAVFGALAGAMFGGLRPSLGQSHRGSAHSSRSRNGDSAPANQNTRSGETERVEKSGETERVEKVVVASLPVAWAGPVFWPNASDDVFDYMFQPNGAGGRFWAYGAILNGVFVDSGSPRGARAPTAERNNETASDAKDAAIDLCGSAQASSSPDGVIVRIEEAVTPNPQQREPLEALRSALAQGSERIKAACRTSMPATPLERLDAMQDRIWAMRDALLTVRVPLENFYNALDARQKARLNTVSPTTGSASDGLESASLCTSAASAMSDTRGIERVLRPTKEQRANLQALQMRLGGLTQLIMSSCPTEAGDSPLDRLSAASDRLTVMLFAVMTMGPALQSFYDSLSDKQKADLGKMISQQLRPRPGT